MSNDRDRLQKVLSLAINPGAIEGEAVAALHRARELVKQNPSLAHPPVPPASPPFQPPPPQATFKVSITSVHPDWILILVGFLSKTAYELELKHKIEFDFSQTLTAVNVICDGSQTSCASFEKQVEWCIRYSTRSLRSRKARGDAVNQAAST